MRHERKGLKRSLSGGLAVPCGSITLPDKHKGETSGRRRNRSGNMERLFSGADRGPSYCCGCKRWRGSKLRRASIVGIHVLGFLACPCQGFVPTGSGAGLLPDRQTAGDCDRRSAGRTVGVNVLRCSSDGAGAGAGAPALGRDEGRRRRREIMSNSRSAGVDATACAPTRLRSAEEARPLGLLYDQALLKAGVVAVAETAAAASSSRNGDVVGSGKVTAAAAAAAAGRCAKEGDLTARWAYVVNGAMTGVSTVQRGEATPAGQDTATTPVTKRKWSGKGWLGIGASWRAGEGWSGPSKTEATLQTSSMMSMTATGVATSSRRTAPQSDSPVDEVFAAVAVDSRRGNGTDSPAGTAPRASNLTTATSSKWSGEGRSLDGDYEETTRAASTLGRGGRRSWRVWQGPEWRRAMVAGLLIAGWEEEEEEEEEVEEEEEDVCVTAREELTLYLLETGATHYDVATAWSALFAIEPELALTQVTWRRWRQNLEGLRSTGFTGSDVAHMLALCPQLLALDYEGQVVPAMELLRKQLGMRPTDVRRVIRKAPDVLAPRADGSTATETVNVLRALGLQTRHLRLEALRWPQLLAVPPSSFFQLAAFLASEEVGIKATNIGSLIRQAPWLVLQRIDGQMLPVAMFLRRAGVTDMERVVRAYPRILCSSIRGDLAPRVRFLWKDVGVSEEDLPRVLQTFPLLFALPLSRMQDVVSFLAEDLTINGRDVAKIIRAFPSLLGLERERHMVGVVQYLKKLGVQNVGRFVSRLPPVLGYDVDTNLSPKMDYLVEKMGLSVYDVLTFPAYFSYPLDTVIEPRTEFLNIRGRPVTLVGVNIALQQGDADFARKVAKVQPSVYRDFKKAYMAKRQDVRSGKCDVESLLSETQRKAIGNMGGQSTNNNVSEVTARATGLPPKEGQQSTSP